MNLGRLVRQRSTARMSAIMNGSRSCSDGSSALPTNRSCSDGSSALPTNRSGGLTFPANHSSTPSHSRDDPAFLLQGLPPLSPPPPTLSPSRSSPATLLIIYHSRTGQGEQMARSLEAGALEAGTLMEQDDDLVVEVRRARDAQVADLLAADGFLFCAPENLASVSGEMKEFFDRCYYGALGHLNGRPFGLAISGGTDGHGAATQVARICQGWRLRPVTEPLVVRNGAQTPEAIAARKALAAEGQEQCSELGGLVAAHLLMAK